MIKIVEKGLFNSIDEFRILQEKNLGTGSFGVVKLAIHCRTYRVYALKIISLENIASQAQLRLIERQIKLHSQVDSPSVVKLWDTIVDQQNIYMILEYAENGNLFYYQNKKVTFPQAQAYKFFIQTVQAVRYLHQHDILHRDLKPENLLLDSEFNIKLCDFGWCTEKITNKRNTFCGTYQYMAPQMIFGRQYDYKIDIWALGILLYQMLHGNAPFKGQTAKEVKQKMLRGKYNISNQISEEAKDLLMGILKFDAEDRLQISQILSHPWVAKLSKIVEGELPSQQKKFNHKSIHTKICMINLNTSRVLQSPKKQQIMTTVQPSFHKKTSSMDFDSKKNLNINLSINNYAVYQKKKSKPQERKDEQSSDNKRKFNEKRCQTQQDETKAHMDEFSLASPRVKRSKEKKKLQQTKKGEKKKSNKISNLKLSPQPHRRSQEQLTPQAYLRYKTDLQVSSRNVAKLMAGNLKKSRNKDLVGSGKLKNQHLRSQHCLGVTQKLKKK